VGLAAILGEGVYNFGELLQHPVLSKLTGTPKQWISELLHAFNRGDLATFKTITAAQVLC
jgi:26S proteasome regulatory subunit N9